MSQSLQGKTAIITGAGKGIGRATALALAKEGVHLGLLARTQADLEKVAEEAKQEGVTVSIGTADVSSNEEVKQTIDQLKNSLGKIDILINNAGIAKFGSFMELDPAEWEKIIQVNLLGMYYVTRAVFPTMVEQKSGDIINISSTAGQKGGPVTSAYSASKAGVLGLTESLAMEARKHDIRVTALTPSTVVTDLAIKEGLVKGNEDNVLQAEDMAELIVSQLKLNKRVFVKTAGLWTTNP
ncbi:3-ketoacyl-ACP reductase [Virgibacillus alimentarius]|uniref:3-oxoacyl-[acyl-carrier protein] reductase n=1 Tax=Virgibacillus alimentarius TaxID=698769 RepID=A0ABS4S8D4_9BACI|nr:3-ketoacyl-ACP reductase [Virgibacillus alimentarius]MBP2257753.1 3-oxoacyl-[acyl-carrier protein] reductase [Virgibacillus alimentarius]